jgi:aspartate 1-decarboxylase
MVRKILHSKIHMPSVTAVYPEYHGSLSVDTDLLDACGMRSHDAVLVANCRNGERFETYIIPLERGSRRIEVNGAAARLADVGDRLIVFHFAFVTDAEYAEFRPTMLLMRHDNTVEEVVRYEPTPD